MDVFLSDFDSYSDHSSSSDDQEDDEFMYGGQASSILMNLQETIGKIDDFLLFERRYTHGDIVIMLKDQNSPMGKVTNVELVVDLEDINEKKLKNITSKELQRIRSINVGDYVISGPWVGKADQITDSVTVLFDDGTKCEFTTTEMEKLVPLSQDLVDDYPYYPGQRVKTIMMNNSTISNSSHWFCGSHNEKQTEGTVCTIDAGSVYVTWLGCVRFGSENVPVPKSLQSSKDLTLVSCFSDSHWQVGDWCVYNRSRKSPQNFQEIFVISKIKSKVDVLWQDGNESYGLDSGFLGPVNTIDAHDFWPDQLVLEKTTPDDGEDRKWGVVKVVDAKEKTVKVKWESETKTIEEIVSAYELIDHPDYTYSQGDLVFKVNKDWILEDIEQCCSDSFLDRIGIVVGLKNGIVEVKWATGFTSKVGPTEIFRVEKTEGVPVTPSINENIEPKQEKNEHDNRTPDSQEKDFSDSDNDEKDCLKTLYDSTTFTVSRAAMGFLSNFATRLFGTPSYSSVKATSLHIPEIGSLSGSGGEENNQMFVETCMEEKFEEVEEVKNVMFSSNGKNEKEILRFDMVNDCSNHHFVDSPGTGSFSSQVKKCWLKKVQQEWNILANDLPENIYVRVFEERMDLIQAAILGAPGTPYHDGVFFFDIFLPPEYPHVPPMVHYDSGGLRVNPNLYESGRVCLSLLNTWTGTGTETWNPNGSTILQVLLSLQALVLNKNPYFNEAGYDRQVGSVEGEKNSCSYNENAFLMTCKSMLYVLRKPPKHFELLVDDHFSKRCKYILGTCREYLEGVPIGYAFDNENVEPEAQKGNSTGFKIMLTKLTPKLVEAFTAKGFDCGEYSNNPLSLEL